MRQQHQALILSIHLRPVGLASALVLQSVSQDVESSEVHLATGDATSKKFQGPKSNLALNPRLTTLDLIA